MRFRQFLDAAARFRVPVDWTMIQLLREPLPWNHVRCTLTELICYASAQLEHCPEDLLPQVLTLADGREMDWQPLEGALRMLASEDPRDREHAARRCRAVILEVLLLEAEAGSGPLDEEGFFGEYWTFHEFWSEFADIPAGIGADFLQLPWSSEDPRRKGEPMFRFQREWLAHERTALGLPTISADAEPDGCATS